MKHTYMKWILSGIFVIVMLISNSNKINASEAVSPEIQDTENDENIENVQESIETQIIEICELDLGDYNAEMYVGEKQLLVITALPTGAQCEECQYTSSNNEIATINGMGRITAVAAGVTEITVVCGNVSEQFLLTVKEEEQEEIPITDIEISDYEIELAVGDVMNLYATIVPNDATEKEISYYSSDSSIATVNSSGEVKGISKGNVIIYCKAGEIIKEIPLVISVDTTMIELSDTYVVLKEGQSYQIVAEVKPTEANQNLIYKVTDNEIISVNDQGLVIAKSCGNAAVIISNEDTSRLITIIVNQDDESNNAIQKENKLLKLKEYSELMTVQGTPIITTEMLRYFHENDKNAQIVGDGYIIYIDGAKIVNYNNEFITNIQFESEQNGIVFQINNGNKLCGEIRLCLDEKLGDYLYLYNESKEKYELIKTSSIQELVLTSEGQYLITKSKLCEGSINKDAIGISLVIVLLFMMGYVLAKKKYWFW